MTDNKIEGEDKFKVKAIVSKYCITILLSYFVWHMMHFRHVAEPLKYHIFTTTVSVYGSRNYTLPDMHPQ